MTKATSVFFAAVLVLYAVGPAFPEMDRKEAAAAWSVQHALDTGSWLIPGQPEGMDLSKPPVLFWFRAAVGALAGRAGTLAVRLPSLLGAAAIIALTFLFARAAFGAAVARLAAAILVLTPDFFFYSTSGVAGHDVLLCLCFLAVVFFADALRRTRRPRHLYLMGIAAGVGCLVKAQTILLFIGASAPLLAVLAVTARAQTDRRLLAHAAAAGLLAACVGSSWYLFVVATIPGALDGFVSIARTVSTRGGDFHLPHYFVEAGFPWSVLWPFVISSLVRRRFRDPDPGAVSHLLAWTAPLVIVVLFVLKGAPYYLMTLFPFFSIILAREIGHRASAGVLLPFVMRGFAIAGAVLGVVVAVRIIAFLVPEHSWSQCMFHGFGDDAGGVPRWPAEAAFAAAVLVLAPAAWAGRKVADVGKVFRFLCAVAAAALVVTVAERADRASRPGYIAFAVETNALLEQYPDRVCLAATAPQVLPTWWIPCFDRNATIEQIELERRSGRPLFVITYIEQKRTVEALGCARVLSGGSFEDDAKRLHLFRCPPR